jgi:uncharacterized membrane protein
MRLNKKLLRWQTANLIDEQTVQKILLFEKSSSRPIAIWAAGGLGALAIIIGIISVVAANWINTPDSLKLAVDIVLCAALAYAVYKVSLGAEASQEKLWLREILVILYYGFTLASMGLIAQVYQLDESIARILLVWTIVTLPLVLLARGKFIAILWVVGTAITYGLNIESFHEFSIRTLKFNRGDMYSLALSLALIGPLLFLLLSRLPALQKHRPVFAREISRYSWLVIILLGFSAQFLWYARNTTFVPYFVFVITGCVTAITAYLIPALYCILAWAALKFDSTRWFNFVTALISIRIVIIYIELFGSMLQTGLGMITGGVLTLLLAWLWIKKSGSLAGALTTVDGQSRGDSDDT